MLDCPVAADKKLALRKLNYPGKPRSLMLELPGFQFDRRESRPDGTGVMVMGLNKERGLSLSSRLGRAS